MDHKNGTAFLPLTCFAEVDGRLLGNAFCDVDLGSQTSHAHVGWVGLNRGSTLATQSV